MSTKEFNGVVYDSRHGGPFDRGSADSYYQRGCNPHYFTGDTYNSVEVTEDRMSAEEISAYKAGYEWNESLQNFKNWY